MSRQSGNGGDGARYWFPEHGARRKQRVLAASRLLCPPEGNIGSAWTSCRLHEHAGMLFALHPLRAGDVFVDVGSAVTVAR